MSRAAPLLEVERLRTRFLRPAGEVFPVDGVSFSLEEGRTLGLLGESGCGKSMTALSLLRLLPEPGRIVSGRALLRGVDLLSLPEPELRRLRGREVSMVFQEPATALNPVLTVGEQVAEVVRAHEGTDRAAARRRAVEMLAQVGLPEPERRADWYPHELSGGMRQRAMLAIALVCRPSLLIADEPTTALDVTVQAQVLELLRRVQRERRMAVLLITHDLGVVAEACDEVAVMYAGRVVERAPVEEVFSSPAHPYSAGLLRSLPSAVERGRPLRPIGGSVPALAQLPRGCRFRDRCDRAGPRCDEVDPTLEPFGEGRLVACHHPLPAPLPLEGESEGARPEP